jgi:hypothetical protein
MAAGLFLSGLFWLALAAVAPVWVVGLVAAASSLAVLLMLLGVR